MSHQQPCDVLRRDVNGIDLELIEYNLSLTPAERVAQHDRWTRFVQQVDAEDEQIDGPLFQILRLLHQHAVGFIVIDDSAASVHGCFDVIMRLTLCVPLNVSITRRIIEALHGTHPRFRTSSDRQVLTPEDRRLHKLKNLYLRTDLGQVDIVDNVPGVGDFDRALTASMLKQCGTITCPVLNHDALIASENAAGQARRDYLIDDLRRLLVERCS